MSEGISGTGVIGSAVILVGVNSDGVTAGLREAKAVAQGEIGELEKTTNAATGRIDQSWRAATKSVASYIQMFTRVSAIATAVVASLNAVGAVVRYVTQVFGDGNKVAEKFIRTLSAGVSADALPRLEQLRSKIESVQSELARAEETPLIFRGGRSKSTIEEELEGLRKSESATSRQIAAQRERAKDAAYIAEGVKQRDEEAIARMERLAELQNSVNDDANAQKPAHRVAEEELRDRLEAISNLRQESTDGAFQRELDRVQAEAEKIGQKKLADINKEQGDAAVEAFKEVAGKMKEAADGMKSAVDDFRQAQASFTNQQLNMAADIRRLRQVGEMRRDRR